jgi:hypothetical protein
MFYQAGRLLFASDDRKVVHVGKLSKFSFGRSGTKITASGFPLDVAPIQTLDSAIQKEEYTLKVSQESFDELDLQFVTDQVEQQVATIVLPGDMTKAVVPATAPYEVTVTGLTADQPVKVTVVSDTAPKYLSQVTGATAIATGNYKVTANTITFHADQAGATIALFYLEAKTTLKVIGGNAPAQSYGVCAFKGIIKGTRTTKHLYFPRIAYTRDFEFPFGDKSEVGMEFDILAPGGWSQPYAIWNAA